MPTGIPSETEAFIATVFELLIQIIVHCRIGKPDSSKVFIPKGGSNKLGVLVGVLVAVFVGVLVGVLVGVSVGRPVGVEVGVLVVVLVGVFVGVSVGVFVDVLVAVFVGVSVGVFVAVLVGVAVGVLVGVSVGVFVGVAVGARTVTVSEAVLFPHCLPPHYYSGQLWQCLGDCPRLSASPQTRH